MQALSDIPADVDLGCARRDIGTHSNRKFAESTSVSKIDGPSWTQVCLRAGQGVGRTQDCYMFSEEDGDSLVGRTVAQLKMDADEFDILPCHFDESTLKRLHEYGWQNILDGYNNYPVSYQRVIRYLFPTLVYHYFTGALRELYAADHPLFSQRIFTDLNLVNSLKGQVLVHGYCNCGCGMNANGVPGIVLIARELRLFRAHYNSTCNRVDEEIKRLGVEVKGILNELPNEIMRILLDNITGIGVQPITSETIRNIFLEMFESPTGQYSKIAAALSLLGEQQLAIANRMEARLPHTETVASESQLATIHLWPNDDVIHMVPFEFTFPSYVVNTMWNLWFLGDSTRGICAFKNLKPSIEFRRRIDIINRSRTKKVIDKMIAFAINGGIIRTVSEVTKHNLYTIYEFSYPMLLSELYGNNIPPRCNDININTLANRIKYKK